MTSAPRPVAILAGGLATRLRPATAEIPKALIDVNGEPFISHQLRLLRAQGVERVVICAGYLGEMIQDWVGNGSRFGLSIEFSFDGPLLRGTAGAIKNALPRLGRSFLVIYGDSYLPCDFRMVQATFEKGGQPALMTVFRNNGRWDRSNVELDNGRIVSYDKQQPTPRMQHIDYGLGVFSHVAFDAVPLDQPFDLATLYRDLLRRGALAACEVTQRFYEIGSFEGLDETRRALAEWSNSLEGEAKL